MPRVSIILNIRNGASFLREAIQSALDQTFTNWEMIAWDDCSTDASAEIVQSYSDARISYYLSPDYTDLGQARNSAVSLARGEWLAFLDQDDVWLHCKLEQQLALLQSDEGRRVGLLYGRTVSFDGKGGEWDFDHKHEFVPLPEGDIFKTLFRDSCFIAMSSAVIRTDALQRGGPIPSEFGVIADYFMYVQVARHFEARAVQHPVCRYRVHPANMSHGTRRRENEEALQLIALMRKELPPELARLRTRIHWTLLAVDACLSGTPVAGIRTLVTRGSIVFLASRPGAIAWRAVRRRIERPRWQVRV